jgi:hypothetical protein
LHHSEETVILDHASMLGRAGGGVGVEFSAAKICHVALKILARHGGIEAA